MLSRFLPKISLNQFKFSAMDHADTWASWKQPQQTETSFITGLKLRNNLSPNQLVPFIPQEGRHVKFYYCGPTVYSYSHLGHARTYIYLDIIKRILRDYFQYDLFSVMNITDIEDKIIKGANEQNIDFLEFTKRWEKDFFDNMEALNVELPDVITRVTEFVPDIVKFIEQIISNGYAYESNGSVYFDVTRYTADGRQYCKLEPFSAKNTKKLNEGEGYTQTGLESEKKGPQDFALWKNSKPGEPKWPSPWGEGRPGWHIECSVMAHAVLGDKIDISAGGEDLKFPHHDNSIVQTEAYLKCDQWINYFIHTGHLNIEGSKMSKSEKNFLTIQQILERYTGRQLRLNFIFHRYDAIQNYSEDGMKEAINKDIQYNQFFLKLKANIRTASLGAAQRWEAKEVTLHGKYLETEKAVHESLCDNLNFGGALKAVDELINYTNIYVGEPSPQKPILSKIYQFIGRLMKTLGLQYDRAQESSEDLIAPLMDTFASFRDKVRIAGKDKNFQDIFKLCDQVRDDELVFLGIKLEDKAIGQPSVWKYQNKEELLQERNQKLQLKAQQEQEKLKKEEVKKAKLEQAKIPPTELFKSQTNLYSQFDANGVPTHDAAGKELPAKKIQQLNQEWNSQQKLYKQHLEKQVEEKQVEEKQVEEKKEQ